MVVTLAVLKVVQLAAESAETRAVQMVEKTVDHLVDHLAAR